MLHFGHGTVSKGSQRVIALALFTALLLSAVPPLPATLTVPLSIADFANSAEVIFAGTVSSRQTSIMDSSIVTTVTFTDLAFATPNRRSQRTLDLRMWGGQFGQKVAVNLTAPTFKIGERYVILARASLGSKEDRYTPFVGHEHSWFLVRPATGKSQHAIVDRAGREVVGIADRHLILVEREMGVSAAKPEDDQRAGESRTLIKTPVGDVAYEIISRSIDTGASLSEAQLLDLLRQIR